MAALLSTVSASFIRRGDGGGHRGGYGHGGGGYGHRSSYGHRSGGYGGGYGHRSGGYHG